VPIWIQFNRSKGTEIYAASHNGHDRIVQMLLEKGARVNIRGGHYITPVRAASICGYSNIVQMLVDNGADIDIDEYYSSSYSS